MTVYTCGSEHSLRQAVYTARANPDFPYSQLDGMLGCAWVERGTVRVKCPRT